MRQEELNKLKALKEKLNSEMTQCNEIKHIDSNINKINYNVHSDNANVAMSKTNYTNIDRKPERMEIWYVNFGQRKGSLQSGIRPCLISSNPINNKYANIRNVFPITSKINKKLPIHVEIDNCGLQEKSLVLTEQITTIDIRYDLMYYVGMVDEATMRQVDIARNIQLGELVEKTAFERLSYDIQNAIHVKLKDLRDLDMMINRMEKGNCSDKRFLNLCINDRENIVNGLLYFCEQYKLSYNELYTKYKESDIRVAI